MYRYAVLSGLIAVFVSGQICISQDMTSPVDLVESFKPRLNSVSGQWSKSDAGIEVAAGSVARAVLAEGVSTSYSVDVELTRQRGSEVVALILPVGPTSVALELGGWGGVSHGLSRVDGQPTRSEKNPTSVRPGKLENGRRYKLSVSVSVEAGQSRIAAKLDGKGLINWKGPVSRLQPHYVFNLPKPGSLGLASKENDVVIHKVGLTSESVFKPKSDSPPTTPNSPLKQSATTSLVNLGKPGTPGWSPFNGARFTAGPKGESGVVRSVPDAGSGDRGAFIEGLAFKDGTIEVELKGDARPQGSFIGVVFGGVDRRTYESVYFRPFNFGVSDPVRRSHAVQYISHPEWPWKRLRDERNGQFEKAVSPEPRPADWFKVRVEITGDTVRVFVNDVKEPSLQVTRLTKRRSGNVGLWFNGIAMFKNLNITR